MPTKVELDDYLLRAESVPRPDLDARLNHLHRVTSRRQQWPELCIFAFDHRKQLADLVQETGRDTACIPQLKLLLLAAAEAAAQEAGLDRRSGILADGTYGQRALNAITGKGWWIGRPIELPGSRPLRLEHGNIGSQLIDWPLEQVVKCLVFYHPADPAALRAEQDALLLEVWQACNKSGHELLLEVILPESGPDKDERHYYAMLEHFYRLGIQPDWWKLPPLSSANWEKIAALIEREDNLCRGILILGLDAPPDRLRAGFAEAANHPIIKGFAVGRTIFGQPSRRWMQGELSDEALIDEVKRNYLALIGYWREARG
jgi:5-dehydro-2-deoxygluconokinase